MAVEPLHYTRTGAALGIQAVLTVGRSAEPVRDVLEGPTHVNTGNVHCVVYDVLRFVLRRRTNTRSTMSVQRYVRAHTRTPISPARSRQTNEGSGRRHCRERPSVVR